jgi:hypothetical protein
LRDWNFKASGPITLSGEWEFYMSELIHPDTLLNKTIADPDYIEFPSTWNDLNKTRTPGFGFATYHMKMLVNEGTPLALEFPHFYTSYSFWVNGVLISANGKVGRQESESHAQYLPRTAPIETSTDTLDVVIHISNFFHAKGGLRENVILGDSNEMMFKRTVAVNATLAMFGILFAIATIFGLLFILSKRQMSLVYFFALCITWGIRSLFSNQYLAISFWPDFSWELAAKIEYIALFFEMIWAVLFVSSLFKSDSNIIFKYLFCFCSFVFILLTLFFDASTYTQFLPVYLSFCAVLLLYVLYVLIRALISERAGALMMILCTFMALIVFSYDLIAYQGLATYNPIITSTGYVIMFLLMATGLMYHLGFLKKSSKSGNVLRYEDLYGASTTTKTKSR